nr:YadA-like family protein [Brucella oryzae]
MAAGQGASAKKHGSIAVGQDATTDGQSAIAIGNTASALGTFSIATGIDANASQWAGVALGTEAEAAGGWATAIGGKASAAGFGSTALGSSSSAQEEGTVAIGDASKASNLNDVALGSNSVTEQAVGSANTTINGEVFNFAGATPIATVSIGSAGQERTITNLAAGRLDAASTDAVNGSQLFATNQAVNNLAAGVSKLANDAVKYDTNPDGTRADSVTLNGGSVSMEGGDSNAPVVLSNVANGVKRNDAVNVGQLQNTASSTLAKANVYSDMQSIKTLGEANTYTDQQMTRAVGEANAYTDTKFGMLSQDIGAVRKEARQAAAIGLAAASLRYDDRPGKLSAAIGGGVWRNEGAFAMGLGYTSQDSKFRTNVSMTTAGGNVGGGVGLSYTFN